MSRNGLGRGRANINRNGRGMRFQNNPRFGQRIGPQNGTGPRAGTPSCPKTNEEK